MQEVYLITNSRADVLKVSSCKQFGEIIAAQWPDTTECWASGCEMHRTDGLHFHCAIILTTSSPWVAQTTRKVIEKVRGGTMFIDEAYTLASNSERDFGKEHGALYL